MSESKRINSAVFRDRLLLPLAVVSTLVVLIWSVQPAEAQLVFGSIVGNVTDPSGGVVPAAAVRVTWTETNEVREATTSSSGSFILSSVHTGTYNVSVSKEGFKGYSASNILVGAGAEVRVDAVLQVGAQTQSIEVMAESAVLQTDHVDVHNEFTSEQLTDLPQPSRMFENLVALSPGVVPGQGLSSGGNNNPSKSISISANGVSNYGTTVFYGRPVA